MMLHLLMNQPGLDFYQSLAPKHFYYALSFDSHQLSIHLLVPLKQKALMMTLPLLIDSQILEEPLVARNVHCLVYFHAMLMVQVVADLPQHVVQYCQKR
uniref:Uncharacterized protein n=1 Tax=Rhizophora mucronata TaxID=61149 RepID=A0A2P2IS48_RHIMU